MNSKKNRLGGHLISRVEEGSIAQELEIEPGDILLEINREKVEDIFDYRYLINEEYLTVLILKPSGEEWELEIEKEYEDDLGIVFENPLLDEYRSCRNHCIFCFIDQMPKGMRPTLYFKDDDSRLSFLQGNYVTLTNMTDHDIDRIIRYHLEPINISFQTMDPELRCRMLGNRFAGDIFDKVKRLKEAGIEMNGQIVLCKGINDGKQLEKSLSMLEEYLPSLKSVSVVPVGLTRFREGLYPLEPFEKEDARSVIAMIEKWQDHYMKRYGTHLVHAGDEWYFLAGAPIPEEASYDGYLQLENGVGMVRLLREEAEAALQEKTADDRKRRCSIACGELIADHLIELAGWIRKIYPGVSCEVFPIRNDFFGERITVTGLLTGQDIVRQLSGRDLGQTLLISSHMLRSGEDVFLDDMTVTELENALQIPVTIVESDGQSFVDAVIGDN